MIFGSLAPAATGAAKTARANRRPTKEPALRLRTLFLLERSDLLAMADIGITDQFGACFFDPRYPASETSAAVCFAPKDLPARGGLWPV